MPDWMTLLLNPSPAPLLFCNKHFPALIFWPFAWRPKSLRLLITIKSKFTFPSKHSHHLDRKKNAPLSYLRPFFPVPWAQQLMRVCSLPTLLFELTSVSRPRLPASLNWMCNPYLCFSVLFWHCNCTKWGGVLGQICLSSLPFSNLSLVCLEVCLAKGCDPVYYLLKHCFSSPLHSLCH